MVLVAVIMELTRVRSKVQASEGLRVHLGGCFQGSFRGCFRGFCKVSFEGFFEGLTVLKKQVAGMLGICGMFGA